MRVLELFSGTGSVGKVCKSLGYDVTSLDLKNADINCDIMNWDYTIYPSGYFDIIWASPPCQTFSCMQYSHKSKEEIYQNIEQNGLPILRRTEEIIKYFNPKTYFIENPQTGKMKEYINDKPFYDVDYCMYSDWGYKKRTRIWSNIKNFNNLKCDKNCGNMISIDGRNFHKSNCGNRFYQQLSGNKIPSLNERYRIPEQLIISLFSSII
jgi:site-specific DNA-cytosine methylase